MQQLMLLIHKTLAFIMLIGGILFGVWLVTLLNDPTCSASPEIAGGVTRILQYLSFCWLG